VTDSNVTYVLFKEVSECMQLAFVFVFFYFAMRKLNTRQGFRIKFGSIFSIEQDGAKSPSPP